MDHVFHTELFIAEIEARPAIWDSRAASYSDKVLGKFVFKNVSRFWNENIGGKKWTM
jgi:hypothetical protein